MRKYKLRSTLEENFMKLFLSVLFLYASTGFAYQIGEKIDLNICPNGKSGEIQSFSGFEKYLVLNCGSESYVLDGSEEKYVVLGAFKANDVRLKVFTSEFVNAPYAGSGKLLAYLTTTPKCKAQLGLMTFKTEAHWESNPKKTLVFKKIDTGVCFSEDSEISDEVQIAEYRDGQDVNDNRASLVLAINNSFVYLDLKKTWNIFDQDISVVASRVLSEPHTQCDEQANEVRVLMKDAVMLSFYSDGVIKAYNLKSGEVKVVRKSNFPDGGIRVGCSRRKRPYWEQSGSIIVDEGARLIQKVNQVLNSQSHKFDFEVEKVKY